MKHFIMVVSLLTGGGDDEELLWKRKVDREEYVSVIEVTYPGVPGLKQTTIIHCCNA